MNYTLLAFYSNIFGFIVHGIALLNFIVTKLGPHLPRNKIKTMDILFLEAETALKESVEKDLLAHEFVQVAKHRLRVLSDDAWALRLEVIKINTLWQDYMGLIRGKSAAIGDICDALSRLRAEIIILSAKRRRGLQVMSWIPVIIRVPPTLRPAPILGPSLPPAAWIPRPGFRPSVLPVWQSNDRVIDGDPYGDSTQIDSDARTTDAFCKPSDLHTPVNLEPHA